MTAAVLLALAAAGILAVASSGSSAPEAEPEPDATPLGDAHRTPVWGPEHIATMTVECPEWYRDVVTFPGNICGQGYGFEPSAEKVCPSLVNDVHPKPFTLRLGPPPTSSAIITCDIQVTDDDGIVNRTMPRWQKYTSGRKSGKLDVNEYTLSGGAYETAWCERLARAFPVVEDNPTQGEYLTRHAYTCPDGVPRTKVQNYSLYRALRTVTPSDLLSAGTKIREWFAKINGGIQPYPYRTPIPAGEKYRAVYDLRLGLDSKGVYISGTVAASLAPQTLHVQATWKSRAA